jgi:hypothetical protein
MILDEILGIFLTALAPKGMLKPSTKANAAGDMTATETFANYQVSLII